ncbi:MAG: hypothetical protein ACTSXC_03590 [Candidatus Freyarchaeota archaeon]
MIWRDSCIAYERPDDPEVKADREFLSRLSRLYDEADSAYRQYSWNKTKSREVVLKYRRDSLLKALKKFVEDNRERINALVKKYGTEVLDWIPEAWSLVEWR